MLTLPKSKFPDFVLLLTDQSKIKQFKFEINLGLNDKDRASHVTAKVVKLTFIDQENNSAWCFFNVETLQTLVLRCLQILLPRNLLPIYPMLKTHVGFRKLSLALTHIMITRSWTACGRESDQ